MNDKLDKLFAKLDIKVNESNDEIDENLSEDERLKKINDEVDLKYKDKIDGINEEIEKTIAQYKDKYDRKNNDDQITINNSEKYMKENSKKIEDLTFKKNKLEKEIAELENSKDDIFSSNNELELAILKGKHAKIMTNIAELEKRNENHSNRIDKRSKNIEERQNRLDLDNVNEDDEFGRKLKKLYERAQEIENAAWSEKFDKEVRSEESIQSSIHTIQNKLSIETLKRVSINTWRYILSPICNVYILDESFLVRKPDEIVYKIVGKNQATNILEDNLYTILIHNICKNIELTDEAYDYLKKVVNACCININSFLTRVTFDNDTPGIFVEFLPESCIAFKNGVYDFKKNDWLFKYNYISIEKLNNVIIEYPLHYIVRWYYTFDFEPLDYFDITKTSMQEMYDKFYDNEVNAKDKSDFNYCFRLMNNIAHNKENEFSIKRFQHLCEVCGYLVLSSFCQNFVILLGTGQNGKNSLFDGCFTSKVLPKPSNIDYESIENDKFVTGALVGKSQNIYLETDSKTFEKSKVIKQLTGSLYQSIENKGQDQYSGIMNIKYLFAGNDMEHIKFDDDTDGFKRRVNILEIFFKWDKNDDYLNLRKRHNGLNCRYFDTRLSNNLMEIKSNNLNYITFVYFAMLGIKEATKNFTDTFNFTFNDWSVTYQSNVDVDLKTRIAKLDINILNSAINRFYSANGNGEVSSIDYILYDHYQHKLTRNKSFCENKYSLLDVFDVDMSNEEKVDEFTEFLNNVPYMYVNLRLLVIALDYNQSLSLLTRTIKNLYGVPVYRLYNNQAYIKITFLDNKVKIIK